MTRDWRDVFLLDEPAPPPDEAAVAEEPRGGFFSRLRDNLSKTRQALSAEVQATLFEGDLDHEAWERLEEALIYADVGARTTAEVVERLEREATEDDLAPEALQERLVELLAEAAVPGGEADGRIDLRHPLTVVLAVGVNGTGKTTTIGKLAWHLRHTLGRRVVIGAADTFRAAAVE
jgi:fused signal recognition particle receptor